MDKSKIYTFLFLFFILVQIFVIYYWFFEFSFLKTFWGNALWTGTIIFGLSFRLYIEGYIKSKSKHNKLFMLFRWVFFGTTLFVILLAIITTTNGFL